MLHFYTAGESHGEALLAFVSGLPAGLPIDFDLIQHELHRRQLGYGRGGRQKIEKDPRRDIRWRASRSDHRGTNCSSNRQPGLGQLGKDSAG